MSLFILLQYATAVEIKKRGGKYHDQNNKAVNQTENFTCTSKTVQPCGKVPTGHFYLCMSTVGSSLSLCVCGCACVCTCVCSLCTLRALRKKVLSIAETKTANNLKETFNSSKKDIL